MEYIRLGNSGLKVSRLCLGCMTYGTSKWRDWVLDEKEGVAMIRHALDAGINFLDTADMYSLGASEEVVGKALKDYRKREEVVVATKVYHPMADTPNFSGLSRKHIIEGVNASLKRLGTDYIDLYQIHRYDYNTPAEEFLEALNDLVRMGKVLYLGASSMYAWQFAKLLYTQDRHNWSRFISMQNQYNLIYREEEREMNPLCIEEGIGLIPWSPLARGFLAGNRSKETHGDTTRAKTDSMALRMYYSDQDFTIADRVVETAKKRGCEPIQVALAWVISRPGVSSPIIGSRTPTQLNGLIKALDITLSEEEIEYLQEPYRPKAIADHS